LKAAADRFESDRQPSPSNPFPIPFPILALPFFHSTCWGMDQFGLIVAIPIIVALAAYAYMHVTRKRREALSAVADRLGLSFDPSIDHRVHYNFGHPIFDRGRSRKGYNSIFGGMILGGHPIQVRMGDYKYTTGHGKQRQTHRISYATFQLPWVGTPSLLIRRENIRDKLIGGLGFDDIDFESEEFSRAFWVKSDNRRYAYGVVHPRMMEFLLGGPKPHVEIIHDVCLIMEGWGRWDPDTFEGAPGWFEAFLGNWPEHLTHELQPRWRKRA